MRREVQTIVKKNTNKNQNIVFSYVKNSLKPHNFLEIPEINKKTSKKTQTENGVVSF